MGLATIDPHGLKEHAEIHKITKFGVKRPNINIMACGMFKFHSWHAILEKLIHVYLIDSLYKPETIANSGSTRILEHFPFFFVLKWKKT